VIEGESEFGEEREREREREEEIERESEFGEERENINVEFFFQFSEKCCREICSPRFSHLSHSSL